MAKPNYSSQGTDWKNKECRDLYCKSVNSHIMTFKEDMKLEEILKRSKEIVDTAFKNYPDRAEEQAKKEAFELNTIEND